MSNELRQTLQHSTTEYTYREAGSKTQVFLWSVYVFILWALKVCVTAFYSRLTYVHKLPLFPTSVSSTTDEKRTASARLPELRLRVNFAYIMLGTTYVAVALTILLSCRPISKFWQINPNPGSTFPTPFRQTSSDTFLLLTTRPDTCQPAVSKAYAYVVIVPNVLTDLYLLSIPLPVSFVSTNASQQGHLPSISYADKLPCQLLWKVNINWKRKAILLSLFSGAVFSMITGIVRAYIILHVTHTPNPLTQSLPTYHTSTLYLLPLPPKTGRSQRRHRRQHLGLPRDLRRRHRSEPPASAPAVPAVGAEARAEQQQQQQQQVA